MPASFGTALRPAAYFEELREPRYGEPYVLVTRIHLQPWRPDVRAFLYGPWQRASPAAAADVIPLVRRESFWELGVPVAPMVKPDHVMFLVALVEHLDGGAALRDGVRRAILETLDASAGMAHETRLARLIDQTDRAIDRANGGPNVTSAIGIRLRTAATRDGDGTGARRFVLSFSGYGGSYCLHLNLRRTKSDLSLCLDTTRIADLAGRIFHEN